MQTNQEARLKKIGLLHRFVLCNIIFPKAYKINAFLKDVQVTHERHEIRRCCSKFKGEKKLPTIKPKTVSNPQSVSQLNRRRITNLYKECVILVERQNFFQQQKGDAGWLFVSFI